MRLLQLLIILSLFFSLSVFAEDMFKAEVIVNEKDVSISSLITANLYLTYPKDYQPDLKLIQQNLERSSDFYGKSFTLKKMDVVESQGEEDNNKLQIQLTLQPLRIGKESLALFEVVFERRGQKQKVLTNRVPISVHGLDRQEKIVLQDLKPLSFQKSSPFSWNKDNKKLFENINNKQKMWVQQDKQLPWTYLLYAILLLMTFKVLMNASDSKPKMTKERKIILAKRNLKNAMQRLNTDERTSQFYKAANRPIRIYLGKRFDLETDHLTSNEVMSKINEDHSISDDLKKGLYSFLHMGDLVKFAGKQPTLQQCKEAEDFINQLIEKS